MKKSRTIILIIFVMTCFCTSAQDIITLKNGDEIKSKVMEISSSEIKYKRFDNLGGPTVVIEKEKVFAITYENGTREVINAISDKSIVIQETKPVEKSKSTLAKPNIGIFFNPSGFAIPGPMVGAEFSAGLFDIEAGAFFPQAGYVLRYLIDEKCLKTKGGFGVFITPKFYMNRKYGGFYVGTFAAYWQTKCIYQNEYAETRNIPFGINVGYKFILPFGLYFRAGGYFGANVNVFWKEYYNGHGSEKSTGDITIFGFLDLAIGFKFLKVKR
jgi:hypothetical protein